MRHKLGEFSTSLIMPGLLPALEGVYPFPDRVPAGVDFHCTGLRLEALSWPWNTVGHGNFPHWVTCSSGEPFPGVGSDPYSRQPGATVSGKAGAQFSHVRPNWIFPAASELVWYVRNTALVTLRAYVTVWGELIPRSDFTARLAA